MWPRPLGDIGFRSNAVVASMAFVIGDSISQGYRRQAEASLLGMGIATEWFLGVAVPSFWRACPSGFLASSPI